ncbi:MAG: hypothetical protein Q9M89_01095 [Persephonella sp.]|nr:hypothetical protein [Persephonella sp.]
MIHRLKELADKNGISLSEDQLERFQTYLDMLFKVEQGLQSHINKKKRRGNNKTFF